MSSDQVPPPSANFSFPPGDSKLHFNYIDSFVTSWVTPALSKDPCIFSLYYWNGSNPSGEWTSKLNQTVSLNGTRVVPLNYIDSDGLGELNLNYIDPDGSHQKVIGTSFTINHDPTQPKAVTWNQNALTSSSLSTTSSQQATSIPTPSALTTAPSSTTLSTLANTLTSSTIPQPSTSTPSTAKTSSAFQGGDIASIVLGTILGVLITALLIMLWIRRQRKIRTSEQDVRMPSATTPPYNTRHSILEKDAVTAPNELLSDHGRWELPADRR